MLFQNISIKYILPIAFVVASIVPVSVFTAMAFIESKKTLEAEISQDIQVKTQATMAEIDRMMFERAQNIDSWSKLDVMHELRLGDIDKRLSRFLFELKTSYRGIYHALHAVNLKQQIIASTEADLIGKEFVAVQSADYIAQNQQYIFSDKIFDPITGEVSGYLYAVFDWHKVLQIMEDSTGDGRSAALFDASHKLLAETSHWEIYASADAITATAPSLGYQGSAALPWQLAMSQPKSIAFSPIRALGAIFLLFLLIVAAIASAAALLVANNIAKPIRKLSEFTASFKNLPLSAKVPTSGPKELQELSAAFETMIADLKKSQDDLTRAAKLAVVGELAAAMSHEVRTPLGILRSSAQILMREQGLTAEGQEVCSFILSETERMNKLVNTLLDAGRVRPQEISLTDIVLLAKKTVAMLSSQIQNSKSSITIIGEHSVFAACDADQLTQVLLNLLLNAMQAAKANVHIEINIYADTHNACIDIADNGPGIAAELYERVFDPFFSKRQGGIGLGLAVVRQIIVAHHGSITASRSQFGGALFSIKIPKEKLSHEP
jgi:signal transduction histidine kinase